MGCPVSRLSSLHRYSRSASIASASLKIKRPRSDACSFFHAGKALRAAATARSTSFVPASEISHSRLPSWGFKTLQRPPSIASTNSPLMNSRVSMSILGVTSTLVAIPNTPYINARANKQRRGAAFLQANSRPAFECLKLYWIRRQLARGIALGQRTVVIFPNHQNGTLGRIAAMTNVGWHRRHVARLHGDLRARFASLAVFDIPNDLVGDLNEPLYAIVTVRDGQNVFFGSSTELAIVNAREH